MTLRARLNDPPRAWTILALAALTVGAMLAQGCAAAEAGRSQAPASGISVVAHEGSTVNISITGDANGRGQSAPESTATQTPTNTVTPTVTVPPPGTPHP